MPRDPLPREIRALLDQSGRAWSLEDGSRHYKLRVEGRMVLVLPRASSRSKCWHREKNALSAVRRALA